MTQPRFHVNFTIDCEATQGYIDDPARGLRGARGYRDVLERYGQKLQRLDIVSTKELSSCEPWTIAKVAGMVENYQEKLFRSSGSKAAFFSIEDLNGRIQAKVRGDKIEECVALLRSGTPVIVTGKVSFPQTEEEDGEVEPTLLVDSVEPLGTAVQRVTRTINVRVSGELASTDIWKRLRDVIEEHPGSCELEVLLSLDSGVEVSLGLDAAKVSPDELLLGALERIVGNHCVELR